VCVTKAWPEELFRTLQMILGETMREGKMRREHEYTRAVCRSPRRKEENLIGVFHFQVKYSSFPGFVAARETSDTAKRDINDSSFRWLQPKRLPELPLPISAETSPTIVLLNDLVHMPGFLLKAGAHPVKSEHIPNTKQSIEMIFVRLPP
jgi:hypothetical protein